MLKECPMRLACTALLSLALGCGPTDRTSPSGSPVDSGPGGSAAGDEDDGLTVEVTGTVWAPGNAPGMVPPGQEIPVSGAMVFSGSEEPAPPDETVQCTPCTQAPSTAVITDAKGNFKLHVPTGGAWITV